MSARDSESGSSTYKGGSGSAGGLGNGGVGGGMGGGGNHRGGSGGGGGAGRNGGINSRTGLTGGNTTYGNTAFGRSGGRVAAYGTRDARSLGRAGMGPTAGTYGNFRTPSGAAMFAGSPVQGMSFNGMGMGQALSQAQRAQAAWQAAQARPEGLLGRAQRPSAVDQEMALPEYAPVDVPMEEPLPEEVIPAPPVPTSALPFNKYGALYAYRSPYGPEAMAQIGRYGQGPWSAASDAYHSWAGYGPDYGRSNGKGDLDTSNKPKGGFY